MEEEMDLIGDTVQGAIPLDPELHTDDHLADGHRVGSAIPVIDVGIAGVDGGRRATGIVALDAG